MAEETALEMRQAGQPARGFKSLHLRKSVKLWQFNKLHTFLCVPATTSLKESTLSGTRVKCRICNFIYT